MRMLLAGMVLLVVARPVVGQELPKASEEGKKAAGELLKKCLAAGAMEAVKDPRTNAERIVLADQQKLQEVVKQERNRLTPALRDALVHQYEHPGAIALLVEIAQATGDRQAKAFAMFFMAGSMLQWDTLQLAREAYEG